MMNYRTDRNGNEIFAVGMEGSNADLKAKGYVENKDFIRLPSGKLFVKNEKMVIESLFQSGGTACGTFKRMKWGVKFFDHNGKEIFYLVDNRHNEQFFVSCWKDATKDGKTVYMHALSSHDEYFIGVAGMSSKEERAYAEKLAKETRI